MKNLLKNHKFFLLIVLLTILVLAYFSFFHKKTQKPIETATVKIADIKEIAVAVGKIKPKQTVTVKSQLAGTVVKIYHDAGDFVSKGEKLLRIKPNPTPQAIASAIEAVDQYQAAVLADEKQVKKYESLIKQGIISKNYEKYVDAKKTLAMDKAQLELNIRTLDLLKKGKAVIDGKPMESIIKSPVTGYLLQRGVSEGDSVIPLGSSQTATGLYTMANMHHLIFQGSVDELDAGRLKTGLHADIKIAAIPGKIITGTLSKLALQSNDLNSTLNEENGKDTGPFNVGFNIEINQLRFPQNIKIRSGYSATAMISIHEAKNVMTLPVRALIYQKGQAYVSFKDSDKQSHLQKVKTGLSDGMRVEIKDGLKKGDIVILP